MLGDLGHWLGSTGCVAYGRTESTIALGPGSARCTLLGFGIVGAHVFRAVY